MQALLVERLSDDFSGVRLADVPQPHRAPGEILIAVRAAALNFPDVLMSRGQYQFKPELPFIPGMEMAGEVLAADPGSGLTAGDRVSGGAKTGCLAERVCLPVASVRPIPTGISTETAAALGAAYTTAWTVLVELGAIRAGDWVMVTGASGGVGLACCDLARALGARVIAATGSPAKVAALQAACMPDAVVVTQGRFRDEINRITAGALCGLVVELVGGEVFAESTRCVAFGGKLMVAGFASGEIPTLAVNIPLIKGFAVVGMRAGEYARRFPDRGAAIRDSVMDFAQQGRITPHIDRTLPLSRWRRAFAAMTNRELIGKVVFTPGN